MLWWHLWTAEVALVVDPLRINARRSTSKKFLRCEA